MNLGSLIKSNSKIIPIKSVIALFLEWSQIVIVFLVNIEVNSVFLILPSIIFIAFKMYACYSLLHEGIHFHLFKSKKMNDIVTSIFLSFPLYIPLKKMRINHQLHHQFLQTEKDPEFAHLKYKEFQFPLSKKKFLSTAMLDLSGLNFIKYSINRVRNHSFFKNIDTENYAVILFHGFLVLGFYLLGIEKFYLFLWVIPYCTVFLFLNRIRTYTEHFNLDDNSHHTRTLTLSGMKGYLFSPYNLGYHDIHHRYPTLPWHALKPIQKILVDEKGIAFYEEKEIATLIKKVLQ
jgi:fatty acid desaturase